jgi:hypothetical protein
MLQMNNIKEWSFDASDLGLHISSVDGSITSTVPGVGCFANTGPCLFSTPETLSFDFDHALLDFNGPGPNGPFARVRFQQNQVAWRCCLPDASNKQSQVSLSGVQVIGQVPEPNTTSLLGVALMAVVGLAAQLCRRKAKSKLRTLIQ